MELSVTPQPTIKRSTKIIALVLIVWLIPTLMLLNLSRAYNQSLEQIEELGIRVTELRQSLYFSEPLRVSRINDMALDAQLVYSLRLQVESDYKNAWIRPDVNQLLYVVDQFLEKFNEFIPIESQVQYLVDDMKALRGDPNTSAQMLPLLNQFGTVVFQAMYSENHTSSSIYRAFDAILEQSYQLEEDEQDALQQLLADASSLLGNYAQLNYLVDRIKKNSVSEQIIALENQYHSGQFYMLISLAVLSALTFCCLAFARLKSHATVVNDHEQPLHSDSEPTESQSTANDNQVSSSFTSESLDQKDRLESHSISVENQNMSVPEKTIVEVPSNSMDSGGVDASTSNNSLSSLVRDSAVVDMDNVVPLQQKEESTASVDLDDDKPVIDIDEMLETLDGDHESVVLLLNVFVEDHANDFNKFMELKTDDEVTAARVVHSLKGVAGSIKASRLAAISTSVEAKMKQSKPIEDNDLQELELAIGATVEAARDHLAKHG
ncbi:Hpt domain-containing protein [Vibrio fortis]|uniref:Hpt domain-containing protein n=1 Tax=Vibrio fortis TaxID=212667 RepID=A0A5N3SBQ1_9VIBR|nr:Hpt domain-containing protein [Vibrio fortis]KAB0303153.1 Hpt domain-containing protein [Vibrio fortis]